MDEAINVYTNNHASPGLSALLMLLLVLTLFATWLFSLWQWKQARRNAAMAMVQCEPQSTLREGARFVSGKVEYADGETFAVRMTITQLGREVAGPAHGWTEVERRVEARPFYLRLDSGERVLVDTRNANVVLGSKFDQMHWVEKWKRQKRAQLVVGDRVCVEGMLQRRDDSSIANKEHRDGGSSWVLMPRAGRIYVYVSTEDVSERYESRALTFLGILAILPLWSLVALWPVYPYFLQLTYGHDEQVPYLGRNFYETRDRKGNSHEHWHAVFRTSRGQESIAIDKDDWNMLAANGDRSNPRRTIWIRVIDGRPDLTTAGRGPTVDAVWWCLSMLLACCAVVVVAGIHRDKSSHEQPLHEFDSGPMPEPNGSVFSP
jgi:hypothetical protein